MGALPRSLLPGHVLFPLQLYYAGQHQQILGQDLAYHRGFTPLFSQSLFSNNSNLKTFDCTTTVFKMVLIVVPQEFTNSNRVLNVDLQELSMILPPPAYKLTNRIKKKKF